MNAVINQSLWIIFAAFLFGVMSVCVKYAAAHFTLTELVFYRSLMGCVLVFALARLRRKTLLTQNIRAHFWRSITGFASLLLFFYAIPHLHLSATMALLQTSPLFLALLAAIFMRERPQPLIIAMLLCSFVGMVLVLRPFSLLEFGLLEFNNAGSDSENATNAIKNHAMLLGGFAALAAGMMAGCAYFNIRRLGVMNEGGIRTVFYFTLFCTLLSLPLLPFADMSPLASGAVAWILIIGLTATMGQLALTRGLHGGAAATAGALMYSSVVFAGFFDYVLWRNVPDAISWLGIAIICTCGVGVMLHKKPA